VHDNPNVKEFLKNTQALRVIKNIPNPLKGNCRGGKQDLNCGDDNAPLPKRPRKNSQKPLGLY